ncbi:MAG TPA: SDR family oxidoreductase [Candidatus Polarisedimenticolia bacterium]|jgi:NAD(P)-dependent dehydrogenase (short-subunit alcohol dehydrogenase family)|nr:SDR family oxidoreductase [Candidatus Polarisedimenticolia bacterium]
MSERFKDRVAVVTGGNSGIGLATARAFLHEGARVAITGRNDATLKTAQEELGADVLVIKADAFRIPEIATAMDRIKERFGRIDALFVNAGIGKFVPFEEVTEAFFDETMATNLKGAFFTVQKAVPLMTRGSAVVLNASINAHLGMPGSTVYGASKAAVVNLAKTLSADLLPRGVRVNVVSPGPVTTPIFERMGLPEDQTRQLKHQISERVPLKRFGQPDEIAAAVLYLASSESSFVVGTELVVDGGMIQL